MGSKRHVVDVDLRIRKDFTKISVSSGEFKGLILFPLIVKISFVMALMMSQVIKLVKVVLVFLN